ncbi:MAG: glycogen synthase GlgA [Pseudomonadota bacterium]
MAPLRVLYVATECAPLLKVGGLADVAAALPPALAQLGVDVRVLLPRVRDMPRGRVIARFPAGVGLHQIETGTGAPLWLLDTPRLRRRSGIYTGRDGRPYDDDAECFAGLCRMATAIAADACGLDWRPDIVHCNEWQTALAPLLSMLARAPAASVLTIHNLAHQGLFALETGQQLGLPHWALQPAAAEYWGQLSFLKTGLVFADRLTTVSPGYAAEILTPQFGAGLDGVLRERARALTGILNGLDNTSWDPEHDPLVQAHFSARHPSGKRAAKRALVDALGWGAGDDDDAPLAAVVSRLAPQKGIDLVLEALPDLLALGMRLVVLGSGDPLLETRWGMAASHHPDRVAVRLGFDETLAHRIFAGSDLFLMPSRFEPCGLTQMCAMRYGAIPVVNPVGGLADTVIDAGPAGRSANGFRMASADAAGLVEACRRAVALHANPDHWQALIRQAMCSRFDWSDSARRYLEVYRSALRAPATPEGAHVAPSRRPCPAVLRGRT